MDQQAKKHLQEEFDAALEEKDQMITVLQTQVRGWKRNASKIKSYQTHFCSWAHKFTYIYDSSTIMSEYG